MPLYCGVYHVTKDGVTELSFLQSLDIDERLASYLKQSMHKAFSLTSVYAVSYKVPPTLSSLPSIDGNNSEQLVVTFRQNKSQIFL